jgi:hypothetical protein
MARKSNRKFTLAVLSVLSVLGSQSLAMNTGNKANRGEAQPVSRELDRTVKMSPKENGGISAAFATLFGLGLAYEVLGNVFDLPTASKGIRYLAGKDKKSGDKVKVGILPVIEKIKYIKETERIFIKENPQILPQNNCRYDSNECKLSASQSNKLDEIGRRFYNFMANQEICIDANKFKHDLFFPTFEGQIRHECYIKFLQMMYSVVKIANDGNLNNSGLPEDLFGDFVRMFKYESGDRAPVFDINNSSIKFENKDKNETIDTKISFEQPEVETTPNPDDDVLFFFNFKMDKNTRYRVTFRKKCFFVEKQQSNGETFNDWQNVENGKSKNINYLDGTLHNE